jgi:hypothetical protein
MLLALDNGPSLLNGTYRNHQHFIGLSEPAPLNIIKLLTGSKTVARRNTHERIREWKFANPH